MPYALTTAINNKLFSRQDAKTQRGFGTTWRLCAFAGERFISRKERKERRDGENRRGKGVSWIFLCVLCVLCGYYEFTCLVREPGRRAERVARDVPARFRRLTNQQHQ